MSKVRKNYEIFFKLEVARMVVEQDLSITQVAKDRDTSVSAVRRWVTQYQAEQSGQAAIGKPLTSEKQRIRQLE
jgi:transposase